MKALWLTKDWVTFHLKRASLEEKREEQDEFEGTALEFVIWTVTLRPDCCSWRVCNLKRNDGQAVVEVEEGLENWTEVGPIIGEIGYAVDCDIFKIESTYIRVIHKIRRTFVPLFQTDFW